MIRVSAVFFGAALIISASADKKGTKDTKSQQGCVHNVNCAQSKWCEDEDMKQYCLDQDQDFDHCPPPMCVWYTGETECVQEKDCDLSPWCEYDYEKYCSIQDDDANYCPGLPDGPCKWSNGPPSSGEAQRNNKQPKPETRGQTKCVHNVNCDQSSWCEDPDMKEYCLDQDQDFDHCPPPMCVWYSGETECVQELDCEKSPWCKEDYEDYCRTVDDDMNHCPGPPEGPCKWSNGPPTVEKSIPKKKASKGVKSSCNNVYV